MSPSLPQSPSWDVQLDKSAPLNFTPNISFSMPYKDPSETSPTGSKQKDDKLPHDASVFVGSLPSNMDQGDLTRMLMDHLSEHTQIKNIKVVRDSKGGVCAFVQCEDANSANALIQTLQSSVPKPFLGRILRYEPARAFRSLLISYRKPTPYIRPTGINTMNDSLSTSASNEADLDLPHSMRIWKHKNSRFHSILYNLEAIQASENYKQSTTDEQSAIERALFLYPLKFNEETLRTLASYFGKLEQFSPLQAISSQRARVENNEEAPTEHVYPEPHRAPRSTLMDASCWEVKWEHRDDCVSALMTLRRVPHLTVTWAHQPAPSGQTNRSTNYQNRSPHNYQTQYHNTSLSSQIPNVPFIRSHPLKELSQNVNIRQKTTPVNEPDGQDSSLRQSLKDPFWSEDCDSSSFVNSCEAESVMKTKPTKQEDNIRSSWNDKCCVVPGTPCTGRSDKQASCHDTASERHSHENSDSPLQREFQELSISRTPHLDGSPSAPAPAVSGFTSIVTSDNVETHSSVIGKGQDIKESMYPSRNPQSDRDIDPTTLFVGGLEMFGPGAWDEEKVRLFFARFGGLESVKVVRPLNSCAAFAFVKFDNAEAPARAVYEEHNRIYEGRAMRVQLRDCNPPRHNWKYNRGRGRPHLHHFNGQKRVNNYRPHFNAHERYSQTTIERKAPIQDVNTSTSTAPTSHTLDSEKLEEVPIIDHPTSPLDLSSVPRESPPSETYREWYEATDSPTPASSSLGSSVSTAGISLSAPSYPYSPPNGAYFPPVQWMNPYPPPGPYQIPYYTGGYAVYPPGIPPQSQVPLPSPPGSDAGGPTGMQPGWPPVGMYTSFIPYAALPSRAHLVEQGQLPASLATQAPVVPTGFIQNEQGTLIAVYQPEALDRYLAGSEPTSAPISSQHPGNLQRWDHPPSQHAQEPVNPANILNPGQSRSIHPFPPSPSRPFPPPSCVVDGVANSTTPPLYRRQNTDRREAQHSYSFTRPQSHPRTFINGRPGHTTMHHPAHIHLPDLGHHAQQPVLSVDWNRRSIAR